MNELFESFMSVAFSAALYVIAFRAEKKAKRGDYFSVAAILTGFCFGIAAKAGAGAFSPVLALYITGAILAAVILLGFRLERHSDAKERKETNEK